MSDPRVMLDCKPELVLERGDHGTLIVSTSVVNVVRKYLLAYAQQAKDRTRAVAKVGCENIRDDIRYMMAVEETALDIEKNLHQAQKRQGVTQ